MISEKELYIMDGRSGQQYVWRKRTGAEVLVTSMTIMPMNTTTGAMTMKNMTLTMIVISGGERPTKKEIYKHRMISKALCVSNSKLHDANFAKTVKRNNAATATDFSAVRIFTKYCYLETKYCVSEAWDRLQYVDMEWSYDFQISARQRTNSRYSPSL